MVKTAGQKPAARKDKTKYSRKCNNFLMIGSAEYLVNSGNPLPVFSPNNC